MTNHQLDFLARIGRYLWRLVIVDNSFKAGSYLLIISIVLLLVARIFGISFLAESNLLFLSPLIGLLAGLVIGLFNKPSIAQVALVVDSQSGFNNYFSTAYECSEKSSPNPVEDWLARDMMKHGGQRTAGFTFRYNPLYFFLFLILSGIMLIIWFTPVTQATLEGRLGAGASISDNAIITISQGLSDIKDRTRNSQSAREFIREMEKLLADIKNNPQDKTVLLERVNKFLQDLPGLKIPAPESAQLQALLEELMALAGPVSGGPDNGQAGTKPDDTFSRYQAGPSRIENPNPPVSAGTRAGIDKSGQVQPEMILKTQEEAINNPYLPGEYKEIVKKYFEQRN